MTGGKGRPATAGPALSSSHLPAWLSSVFERFASWLDRRSAARVPVLLGGLLFASGRRTVTSWLRAAEITDAFRPAYQAVYALGRRFQEVGLAAWRTVRPCLQGSRRLRGALDDSPTKRYGPCVEGAGRHHNPTPGPAGAKFLYGHLWVSLAALAEHPPRGTVALPLLSSLSIRQQDVPTLPPEDGGAFRTKLELAAAQRRWLKPWAASHFDERVAVVAGGDAKKPFLKPAQEEGFEVLSRLRKDAALWSLPPPKNPHQRGPAPKDGKKRICLAKRAGQKRGGQQVECVQYGERVSKTLKTFLATWRPAGGTSGVVSVKEADGWLPLCRTKPDATVVQIVEGAADRNAPEQTFKDVKEVWGAGEQQLRKVDANGGAFNRCCGMDSISEAWAWEKPVEEWVDRSPSPWDDPTRRPSHADKRKALQRQVRRAEIDEALSGQPSPERIRELAERRLALAA